MLSTFGKSLKPIKFWILGGFGGIDDDSAMGYQNASWRDMLLCQPPMHRATFLVNYQNGYINKSFESCKATGLAEVTTIAGGRIRQGELDNGTAFVLEGSPFVSVLSLSQAISEHKRFFKLARYKGDELRMAMGGERELKASRADFEAELQHSWFCQSFLAT